MNSPISIILPVYDSPHLVATAIKALETHSVYCHRLILAFSDIDRIEQEYLVHRCPDFAHNVQSPHIPNPCFIDGEKYRSVKEVIDALLKRTDYPHKVIVVDTTERGLASRERMGDVPIEHFITVGYTDIGIKMNEALKAVETEWVIPFWEDDYSPCLEWDRRLWRTVEQYPGYEVYVPTLVRHWKDLTLEPYPDDPNIDPWESFRGINCHSIYYPGPEYPMTLQSWHEWCRNIYRQDAYIEYCGERHKGFAFPLLMKTEKARAVGLVPEDGSDPALAFDSTCGALGYRKVVSRNALIGNKLPLIHKASEI